MAGSVHALSKLHSSLLGPRRNWSSCLIKPRASISVAPGYRRKSDERDRSQGKRRLPRRPCFPRGSLCLRNSFFTKDCSTQETHPRESLHLGKGAGAEERHSPEKSVPDQTSALKTVLACQKISVPKRQQAVPLRRC